MTARLVSPNTVLANALLRAEEVLTPRILAAAPERIVLVVGTQINGAPHIGTSLVQALSFAMAARLRDRSGIRTEVLFSALDNAPYELSDGQVRAQEVVAPSLTDCCPSAVVDPVPGSSPRTLKVARYSTVPPTEPTSR